MSERSKNIYLNSTTTLVTQICQVLLAFVAKKIFIDTLGVSYLGYNSVFVNILQMLNLADMGIGIAITSYLYEPLAKRDSVRVASLMHIYKKIYQYMGMAVFIIGVVISVFIPSIIKDAQCSDFYLRLLFFINLAGTVSTYYLGYQRTLLIADQKSYVTSLIDTALYFIITVIQIIFLLKMPDYIIYLSLAIGKNILSNCIIANYVHKRYVDFNKNYDKDIILEYKSLIISFVKDVFVSRIGAAIFFSTDNIIISYFRGSILAGFLSNYTMVTTMVQGLMVNILSSIQSTFGNYIVTHKEESQRRNMVQNYFCANFVMGNFVLLCIAGLLQPFINFYFGEALLLESSTAVWLGINLMLAIMLQLPSQLFQIFKLFKYDKVIIAVSASLNIVISVLLVQEYGVNGCLFGTFVTSLIYIFSRFYIVATKIFHDNFYIYCIHILKYFSLSCVTAVIIYNTNLQIIDSCIWVFLAHIVLAIAESALITILVVSESKEFHYICAKLLGQRRSNKINSRRSKLILYAVMLFLLMISIFAF